jgi:sugar O-acyltransferase (sialic acid O-acetyltransferase NeuD family)
MKKLIIIGARGFGREVYNIALGSRGFNVEFEIKGFLDDKTDALDGYNGYPPILDSVEAYFPCEDDIFICALGDVKYKEKYVNIVLSKGGSFITLIHNSALISQNTVIGTGCIIGYYANVSCDIKIGNYVTVQPFTEIGHDAIIGDFCHLNTYSFLGGYAKIGNKTTIHTGAKILPHMVVGDNSIIGAGSVITRNVPSNVTTFVQPAKIISF